MDTARPIILVFISIAAAILTPLHAGDPTLVYSPDKAFVVAWFDTDIGKPIGETRSVILLQLPAGDKPFSLVTFPRNTLASWSPDSMRCVIIDAPDNGNTNTWLFTAKKSGTQSDAVPIDPLKPLELAFHHNWDGKHLWRPGISKATWMDNETIVFDARDNRGEYRITLHMDSLDHPVIERIPKEKPEPN
jgi:hypothetical protein